MRIRTAIGCCALAAAASAQSTPTWYASGFEGALGMARDRGCLVLVYFHMDGSQHCEKLWTETLNAASVAKLDQFVCFGAKATEGEGVGLVQRFGVTTVPSLLFVDGRGQVEDAIVGYVGTAMFDGQVDRIVSGNGTVSNLRAIASQDPSNLALRFDFAMKLAYVGDKRTSDILIDSIRKEDPEGKTVGGARILLRDATQQATARATNPGDPKTWDLDPVRELLSRLVVPDVLIQGWSWLGDQEGERGNMSAAHDAFCNALQHLPRAGFEYQPVGFAQRAWVNASALSKAQLRDFGAHMERIYGPLYESHANGTAKKPESPKAAEEPAMQIGALARGRFLAGDTKGAREAADVATKLMPESEELARLRQDVTATR